jgi:hypothetical protein
LVKTGDLLTRDGLKYEVLIADKDIFVIGITCGGRTEYDSPEIYSNDKSVMSLDELGFTKA